MYVNPNSHCCEMLQVNVYCCVYFKFKITPHGKNCFIVSTLSSEILNIKVKFGLFVLSVLGQRSAT